MTNKLEKFVGIINEALEYNKKGENEVTIYEEKLLNEAVQEILKNFPPKSKE